MAQMIVAAAGAAIGSMAGPLGAKIGWMVGSIVGGALFKPDPTQGPRVEDKKVSASTYGETIPTVWGTDRCKAQFLWSSDLIEAEQDVGGGKGLGGAEGVIYTYSINVLIGVCKSPFAKPRYPLRIWGNGRLIATFNGTGWDVDKALIQRAGVREYIGAADQMPDPVYEAAVGVENAVAYRGQLSIMLEGLQLGDFGNRPPNFEVEVTSELKVEPCPTAAEINTPGQQPYFYTGSAIGGPGTHSAAYDSETRRYFTLTSNDYGGIGRGQKQIEVYELAENAEPVLRQIVPLHGFDFDDATYGGTIFDPENREVWVVIGYAGTTTSFGYKGPVAAIVDADTYAVTYSRARLTSTVEVCGEKCDPIFRGGGNFDFPSKGGGDARNGGRGAWYGAILNLHPMSGGGASGEVSWSTGGSAFLLGLTSRLRNGNPIGIDCAAYPLCSVWGELGQGRGWHGLAAWGVNGVGDTIYIPLPNANEPLSSQWTGGINFQARWLDSRVTLIGEDEGDGAILTGGGEVSGQPAATVMFSKDRKKVFVLRGHQVGVINIDQQTGSATAFESPFTELASLADTGGGYFATCWSDYHDGMLVAYAGSSAIRIKVIDPETDEVIAGPCNYSGFGKLHAPVEIGGGWFAGIGYGGTRIVTFQAPGGVAMGGGIPLSEIVGDICTDKAIGFTQSQINVSALTDIVPGFTIARQVAARGAIETLAQAWFFYGVESGSLFHFRKHGAPSVATIDSGDLGAHIFQLTQSAPEPPYELEHIDEIEAPRQLTVKYIDAAANYDPGTQLAARQVGGSLSPGTLDLPIVLGTDYAAQVAWTHLMRQHAGKKPIKFALSHAYEALEPGDPITVPLSNGEAARVVLANKVSARPLVELDGVLEDGAVWDAVFPGVDRGQLPRQDRPARLESTVLEILDLPPLRAEDNRLVTYFAMSRAVGDAWPGAAAYKSSDGGATYAVLYSSSAEATTGQLTTSLAAWTKGNIFDRENTVRVKLRRGTLSSATQDAVLNGANAAVIGDEIIQFQNATLVGASEWELDTLLRHRMGLSAPEHSTGTRFVLLSAASLRAVDHPLSEINAARLYKGATAGQPVADASSQSFTLAGNAIKPLAPDFVRGTRDGIGNLAVTWIRRARINAEWQDWFDVPLDEPSEQYRVEVYSDASRATVVRREDVTTADWNYSAADQVADFGSEQSTVYLTVYQITPTYHAIGHASEASL